jgi:hypothetical protein
MLEALGTAFPRRTDRRETARGTPDRREATPLNSWLREHGPLLGVVLMGVSAAVVVLSALFCVGLWT